MENLNIDDSYKYTTDTASFGCTIEFFDVDNGIRITHIWKFLGVVLLAIITNRELVIEP